MLQKHERYFNRKIIRVIFDSGEDLVWVGLSDELVKGDWLFTNNQPDADVMIPWNKGEPQNWNND